MDERHAAARPHGRGTSHDQHSAQSTENRVLNRLADSLDSGQFERFFDGQARLECRDNALDIAVPNSFVADLLDRRFGADIRKAAEAEHAGTVRFRIDSHGFGGTGTTPSGRHAQNDEPSTAGKPVGRRTRPSGRARQHTHRLETFVVGRSNRLAYNAAERIAESDGPCPFSPLCIHGASGVGKTHLLQGIAARHRKRFPGAKVKCVTAEAFMNHFVASLRGGDMNAFRRAYRGLDLLCIDDVHFLSNKTQTQNELLHTFDAINLDGARVVLVSDEHPTDIAQLGKALVSRFVGGAVIRLDPPDEDLRASLVRELALRKGLPIDGPAVEMIAMQSAKLTDPSVRAIEGMLTQVEAVYKLLPDLCGQSGRIGLNVVGRALGISGGTRTKRPSIRRPIRLDQILDEVCRALEVEVDDVMGRGRHRRVVLARSMTTLLARRMTTASFPEIARGLGRPNHSTVVTAHQRIRSQMKVGDPIRVGARFDGATIEELAERLESSIRELSQSW
jgi:chromosomal replication initiator protein